MIPLTHQAKNIDLLDDQGHGVVQHDQGAGYQTTLTFCKGSSQVPYCVKEVFQA